MVNNPKYPPIIASANATNLENEPAFNMEPSDTTSESLREPRRSLRTPQKPGFYTLKRFRVTPSSASSDRKKSCSVSKKSSNQPTTPLRGGPRRGVPGASTSLTVGGDAAGTIAEFVDQNSGSELYLGILMATNNRPYSEWWGMCSPHCKAFISPAQTG